MNKTRMSESTSEERGFTLNSNKTNYSGHLCEDNAIYLKTIRSELTEIQPIHGHFGNKININTLSVKKYPCKEMLYLLERPHLYDSNALIIKPNQWFLMESCIIQGCHIDGSWEFGLIITTNLGGISTWTSPTPQKNTEKYGWHLYNCYRIGPTISKWGTIYSMRNMCFSSIILPICHISISFFIKSNVVTCVGLLQVSSIYWSEGSMVWRRGSWRGEMKL